MRTKMQVKGLKELKQALEKVGQNVEEVLVEAVMAGAKVIEKASKDKAPVKTGKLKRSIGVKLKERTPYNAIATIGPNDEGFYGTFVELGTKKMAAKPFLRPAFDENVQEARKEIRRVLKEAVERGV
ncbi:MAG: HK97 gp10 family phage protein [Clostridia bacterium]|nr:HK97 gp10 family phage protein [Clostridia bacterium]